MRLFRLIVLMLVGLALPAYGLAAVRVAKGSHCSPAPAAAVQIGPQVSHAHHPSAAKPSTADAAAALGSACCDEAAAAGAAGACSDGPGCHAAHYLAPVTLPTTAQVVPDPPPVTGAKAAPTEVMVSGLWRPPRPF